MRKSAVAIALLVLFIGTVQADPADLTKTLAPLIDDSAVALVCCDLDHIDMDVLTARIAQLSGLPVEELNDFKTQNQTWVETFRKAGVHRIVLVVSLAGFPAQSLYAIVPLEPGTDAQAVTKIITSVRPEARPFPLKLWQPESFDGALVAASPETLKRLRARKPGPRPGLADALATIDKSAVGLIVLPTDDTRHVINEMVPALWPDKDTTGTLLACKGLQWAALSIDGSLSNLSFAAQSSDVQSAQALLTLIGQGYADFGKDPMALSVIPRIKELTTLLTPKREGTRLVLTLTGKQLDALGEMMLRPLMALAVASHGTSRSNVDGVPPALMKP